jgi:LysR family transcriptional regulator, benzoate and cis,cis-muconate-responsive activator of ben and cat genes
MDVRQLESFVEVAQQGTLTRAAARLRISQPALTRQMHRLERDVGVPLFQRTPVGMSVTAAGAALLPHAKSILGMVGAARDVARTAAPITESVEVGLAPGLPGSWLTPLLDSVADGVPRARLSCTDADSATQLRDLRAGRLDIALVHQSPPPSLAARRIRNEPYGVAVRPGAADGGGGGSWPMRHLHRRRVLVHARNQLAVGHDQLTTRAHEQEISPDWQFASYTEHARQCADTARADLVILTEHSASRLLPGWSWHLLTEPGTDLETFVVRQTATRLVVDEVFQAMCASASEAGT